MKEVKGKDNEEVKTEGAKPINRGGETDGRERCVSRKKVKKTMTKDASKPTEGKS